MEWVREFTTTIRAIADATGIPPEMMYVEKSNPDEKVRKINAVIESENLSHTLPEFFWVRLKSMWYAGEGRGKSIHSDPMMQEIMTMLLHDGRDQGWAIIGRASAAEMARGKSDATLAALGDYELWKDEIDQEGFVPVLNARLPSGFPAPVHPTDTAGDRRVDP